MRAIEGGCLCGGVRYRATAAPLNVRVCHCRTCQRVTGAPLFARVMVPREAVTIMGEVRWYASSPELERGFCPRCGASLFSARAAAGTIGLTMGSLDDPDAFVPDMQIWASRRQAWLRIAGGPPCHDEGPPG